MARTLTNTEIIVKVNSRPELVSPAQKTAWRKFWQKLISEVSAKDSIQSLKNIREEPRI